MIRILFTIPNFNTAGSGQALLNVAMGLDKNKFEVHVACKNDEGAFFQTVKSTGIPVHVFNYEAPMRPVSQLLKKGWAISRIIKQINPDIVHSFHYGNNYGEAIAAKLAGAKWVFTKKNMMWGSDGANAWKIRSALASKIIIQNTEMKSRFYPKSKKTELIEPGILLEQYYPTVPDSAIRAQMNTPENARIIITVAHLVKIKGVDILLKAFESAIANDSSWHLWIIGDAETATGAELHKYAQRHYLDKRVHFAGKQQDVRAYLNHAEIFVLPTRATGEGCPVALIEAMANGKVVIGSAVPGITSQLKHIPHHLFEPENVAALAEVLQKQMRNDAATNKILGLSFQKHAQANYSIQREVKQHQNVYLKLCGS